MSILPQVLYDKIYQAINDNVIPMGKEVIVIEHGENERLYEKSL